MEFENNQSIYIQIANSLSDKILNGQYKTGDKIPSVRDLAAQLGVNPNTIMRTFGELQTKGIIENKRGIGYFITESAAKEIRNERKAHFFAKVLPEFVRQASLIGISSDEIKKHLDL